MKPVKLCSFRRFTDSLRVSPVSPVVAAAAAVATPGYSGDTAAVGELAEETPTEWTDRAGE